MKARVILGIIAIGLALGMTGCFLPEIAMEFWSDITISGSGDSVTLDYNIKNISNISLENCRLEFSIVTVANADPLDQIEYKVWYPSPYGFDLSPGELRSGIDAWNNPYSATRYIDSAVLYGAGCDNPPDK